MRGIVTLKTMNILQRTDLTEDNRRSARDLVDYATRFTGRGGGDALRIINISPFGLMGRTPAAPVLGDMIVIDLPDVGAVAAQIRWVEDGRIGTEFAEPLSRERYSALLGVLPRRGRPGEPKPNQPVTRRV